MSPTTKEKAPRASRKPKATQAVAPDTRTGDLLAGANPPFAVEQTAQPAAPQRSLATLPPAQRAVIVLGSDVAEKQLRELMALSADIKEVKDMAGREQAHRMAMNLKNARVAIEKAGKLAREDATAFSKAVIAEEKRLAAITEAEEERVFKLRDEFDAEQARIKAEEERRERERVEGIKAKIAEFRTFADEARGKSSDMARTLGIELAKNPPTEAEFAEFLAEAQAAYNEAGQQLATLHREAKAREDEAARVAAAAEAQRIEAERLAAAQEKLQAERDEQQRANAAVARITALSKTEGAAAQIGAALEEVQAVGSFAEPAGALVQMAKDMAIAALEPRHVAAVEAELNAATQVELAPEPVQAEAAPEPEAAPAAHDYAPIDWDAPLEVGRVNYGTIRPVASDSAKHAPLPESWSAADDAVTDAEIIETVSAHYGWNWVDAVERIRKIDFDQARAAA